MATLEETTKELSELIADVGEEFDKFPWDNSAAYIHWLAQTYFFVRHTTCFLALTASRWGVKNRDRQYIALNHLKQESSHDLLLLNDLKTMKTSIDKQEEWPITQAFYQTQYYWIEHESPAAHFGYAYLLEGIASRSAAVAYNKITKAHGATSATFLKVHAQEDHGHFMEGLENISHLSHYELDVFSQCMRQAAILYKQILQNAKPKS